MIMGSPAKSTNKTNCFYRLKATGVVDVENPVTQAYQTGRIQELPDDASDDDDDTNIGGGSKAKKS